MLLTHARVEFEVAAGHSPRVLVIKVELCQLLEIDTSDVDLCAEGRIGGIERDDGIDTDIAVHQLGALDVRNHFGADDVHIRQRPTELEGSLEQIVVKAALRLNRQVQVILLRRNS